MVVLLVVAAALLVFTTAVSAAPVLNVCLVTVGSRRPVPPPCACAQLSSAASALHRLLVVP